VGLGHGLHLEVRAAVAQQGLEVLVFGKGGGRVGCAGETVGGGRGAQDIYLSILADLCDKSLHGLGAA
jgi:hypothetical protein